VKLIFSDHAWDDYLFWQKTDKKVLRRINTLIKLEPLKHALSGYWSRRITDEHRFVYKVSEKALHIAQLRYHY